MKKLIKRSGFTLVELAVVIVIIGVLAAFAVPKFRAAVERSKAAESVNYLSSVQAGQERYHARQGTYATDVNQLDITFTTPKYFTASAITFTNIENDWALKLTRSGATAGYGAYTVQYTQDGYDSANSTIESFPKINPMTQT
jgi:prepilin-type N-terminal cleavage/methylation domain-containing protein